MTGMAHRFGNSEAVTHQTVARLVGCETKFICMARLEDRQIDALTQMTGALDQIQRIEFTIYRQIAGDASATPEQSVGSQALRHGRGGRSTFRGWQFPPLGT